VIHREIIGRVRYAIRKISFVFAICLRFPSVLQLAKMEMGVYVGLTMCLARLPSKELPGTCTEVVLVSSYTTLLLKNGTHAPDCWLHAVEIVSPTSNASESR
jgi:hypothetical protein